MAQEQRTDIQFKIDDWIKTNGNKEITGAQMNEGLSLLSDSMFNKIDEPRPTIEPAAKTSASFYVNSDNITSDTQKWYVIVIAEYFASDLGLGLVRFQY